MYVSPQNIDTSNKIQKRCECYTDNDTKCTNTELTEFISEIVTTLVGLQ